MAKDAELDRLKTAQDLMYQRKQDAHRAQQAAWEHLSSTREVMNRAFEAKQRAYDVQDSSWQSLQRLRDSYGPRIEQLNRDQERAFQDMGRAFQNASDAHNNRNGAMAASYAADGHRYKAESQGYVAERRRLISELRDAKERHENTKPAFQRAKDESLVVGFFGQVNPWKGLDLLIEAVQLAREGGVDVQLEVNGAQPPESEAKPGVQFNGNYEPHQLAERMARVDVVAMASTWYENSPMVIQEAFLHGRPVIAPRLGGMAEKIRDGQTGLLVQPNSAQALREVMQRLVDQPELLTQLQQGVQRSLRWRADPERGHTQLYRRLMNC